MVKRPALNRDRIIEAAVAVADRGGLAAVSMRNVAAEVGVEAMSLYHHLSGKDDLLDRLADWIFTGIELPAPDQPWRPAMAARSASARAVLSTHPWALGLIESRRAAGPALLRHHDAVLGCLRGAGFPVALASHAFSVLDAYIYGFVLTEQNLPFEPQETVEDFVGELQLPTSQYPHLSELLEELVIGGTYDFADEFDYGLELILDELERRRRREQRQRQA